MSESQVLDILRESFWVAFQVALPILATALVVGLTIGLLQALTSVQEMTLTFVPKLGAVIIVAWIGMGAMGHTLVAFFQTRLIPLIAGG